MDFIQSLNQFEPITLEEMDGVKLLNRTDTKYLLSKKQFEEVLELLKQNYRVLEVEGKRISSYKTSYLDTKENTFYFEHHQGKINRHKVRFRTYLESGISFLEVKLKRKGKTKKKRIEVEKYGQLEKIEKKFLKKWIPQKASELHEILANKFQRITLVNKHQPERLTIDLNLSFSKNKQEKNLNHHVILELKQQRFNRSSFILKLLKQKGVRPIQLSKYIVGSILFNDTLKYNRFKSRLLKLNKIEPVWNS